MSREIKFRAWDGKAKKMMQPYLEITTNEENISQTTYDPDWAFWFTNIMQYTGLKDKNGKEIYEGDIVKWKISPMYGKSKISFYNAAFRLADYVSEDNALNEQFCKKSCEVIGNIYENPELLNN